MNPKIEHRIGVKAPARVVWDVVKDIENWPSWNPIYPKARGKLGYGEELHLTLALPAQPQTEVVATVIEWVPEEQIHWTTKLKAGLVKTTRYLEIEKLTDVGCIFANGELFDGFLGASAAKRLRGSVYKGFESMGEVVKARAEAAWAAEVTGAGAKT